MPSSWILYILSKRTSLHGVKKYISVFLNHWLIVHVHVYWFIFIACLLKDFYFIINILIKSFDFSYLQLYDSHFCIGNHGYGQCHTFPPQENWLSLQCKLAMILHLRHGFVKVPVHVIDPCVVLSMIIEETLINVGGYSCDFTHGSDFSTFASPIKV